MSSSEARTVTLILKLTDQCNLHCPYCYFYAGEYAALRTRKQPNLPERLAMVIDTLRASRIAADAATLHIVLHGGEPLLIDKHALDIFLTALVGWRSDAQITLQTNGVLVDDAWIDVLGRHRVGIGVSIDGPIAVHDQNRVFANGRGSYDKTVRGLRRLQTAARERRIAPPAILAVFDPAISADIYFEHFFDELGVTSYDILFPDDLDRFDEPQAVIDAYHALVERTWRLWLARDDSKVHIRFIHGTLKALLTGEPYSDNFAGEITVVLDLEGNVFFEDNLRPMLPFEELRVASWCDDGLDAALKHAAEVTQALSELPSVCRSCELVQACGGGALSTRFDPRSGRFEKSFLCDVYRAGLGNGRQVLTQVGLLPIEFEHAA